MGTRKQVHARFQTGGRAVARQRQSSCFRTGPELGVRRNQLYKGVIDGVKSCNHTF